MDGHIDGLGACEDGQRGLPLHFDTSCDIGASDRAIIIILRLCYTNA